MCLETYLSQCRDQLWTFWRVKYSWDYVLISITFYLIRYKTNHSRIWQWDSVNKDMVISATLGLYLLAKFQALTVSGGGISGFVFRPICSLTVQLAFRIGNRKVCLPDCGCNQRNKIFLFFLNKWAGICLVLIFHSLGFDNVRISAINNITLKFICGQFNPS